MAIKNFPWFLLLIVPLFTAIRYLAQGYSVSKGFGELNKFAEGSGIPAIASTYFKAYVDIFVKLPAMLSKRSAFQNKQHLGNFDMFCLIWNFRLPVDEIIGIRK